MPEWLDEIQIPKVGLDGLLAFKKAHGKDRTNRLLMSVARKAKVYEALNTEAGQALLSDIMGQMDSLFDKMAEAEASPREILTYDILRDQFARFCNIIATYPQDCGKLAQTEKEEEANAEP